MQVAHYTVCVVCVCVVCGGICMVNLCGMKQNMELDLESQQRTTDKHNESYETVLRTDENKSNETNPN
jgi:hypothetical protein